MSDQPNSPQDVGKQEDPSECDSSSTLSDNPENISTSTNPESSGSKLLDDSPNNNMRSKRSPRSPRSSPNPTETPFKCHLCDSGFAVRDDCLNHLSIYHTPQFEELMRKTSFDEESRQRSASDNEERRSRPDYSHRKVNIYKLF